MAAQGLFITRFGGIDVLKMQAAPTQPMTDSTVRIRVKAAGVNFADLQMRMGLYPEAPKVPFIPGYEVSGEVIEVGAHIRSLKVGDRVLAGTKFGGYVTEIVLPEFQVRKLPEHLSFAEGASIPVNFMTAWVALQHMARVREGDRVLIESAAGGVGVAATQIAVRAGARVTGVVSSDRKAQAVLDLGASEVRLNSEWESKTMAKERFDIILNASGGKLLKKSLDRLEPCGRVVSFGVSAAVGGDKRSIFRVASTLVRSPIILPLQLMMKNIGIYGLNVLQLFVEPKDPAHPTLLMRSLDSVLQEFDQKHFKVLIGKEFPLEEGGAAHLHLQGRGNIGKVVLTCS